MPFVNFIPSKNPVPIHAIYLLEDKGILCELGQKDVRIQPKSQSVLDPTGNILIIKLSPITQITPQRHCADYKY